jgi:hypothetical protein
VSMPVNNRLTLTGIADIPSLGKFLSNLCGDKNYTCHRFNAKACTYLSNVYYFAFGLSSYKKKIIVACVLGPQTRNICLGRTYSKRQSRL